MATISLSGRTWVGNDTINQMIDNPITTYSGRSRTYNLDFECDGVAYTSMILNKGSYGELNKHPLAYEKSDGTSVQVARGSNWSATKYKTLYFPEGGNGHTNFAVIRFLYENGTFTPEIEEMKDSELVTFSFVGSNQSILVYPYSADTHELLGECVCSATVGDSTPIELPFYKDIIYSLRTLKSYTSDATVSVPIVDGQALQGYEGDELAVDNYYRVSTESEIVFSTSNTQSNATNMRWAFGLESEEPTTSTATVITYNGSTIATLEAGQTATIKTAETEVDHDIIVKAGSGSSGGGSAEFNIAYGDTAPSDTSKLWVKASEPNKVSIATQFNTTNSFQTNIAKLPNAAFAMGTAAVGTKIYLFGGSGKSGSKLNTIQVLNTETNVISTLSATLPAGAYIGTAAVGTKIYLFGGQDSSNNALNTIQVFNTETNVISTLSATVSKVAMGIGAAAVGTKIYLFGGANGTGRYNTIQVFNTETNTISTLSATLPAGAYSIGTAAVGTKIYLFGGQGSNSLNTIQVFDTETNTISTLSVTLPKAANGMGTAAVGTKIYLFGGSDGFNAIQVFDTETNTISTLSATLPSNNTGGIGTAAVGTKIYLFGGAYMTIEDAIHSYTLAIPVEVGKILIVSSITDNLFNLINTETTQVSIGVDRVYIGNAEGNAEAVDAYLHNGTEWVAV